MRRYRLNELPDLKEGHILQEMIPGPYLSHGGLAFEKPGYRAHTNDGPGGIGYHVHEDCEAFIILQGKGRLELKLGETAFHPVTTGDIIIIEPGEDHHLISSTDDPLVVVWCHAGPERHKNQVVNP